MCTHMHTHMHAYTPMNTHMLLPMRTLSQPPICMHMHAHVYKVVFKHVHSYNRPQSHVVMHTCVHTTTLMQHPDTCAQTCVILVNTHLYACTHIYMKTHVCARNPHMHTHSFTWATLPG